MTFCAIETSTKRRHANEKSSVLHTKEKSLGPACKKAKQKTAGRTATTAQPKWTHQRRRRRRRRHARSTAFPSKCWCAFCLTCLTSIASLASDVSARRFGSSSTLIFLDFSTNVLSSPSSSSLG